jgi:hypothetical protein
MSAAVAETPLLLPVIVCCSEGDEGDNDMFPGGDRGGEGGLGMRKSR